MDHWNDDWSGNRKRYREWASQYPIEAIIITGFLISLCGGLGYHLLRLLGLL